MTIHFYSIFVFLFVACVTASEIPEQDLVRVQIKQGTVRGSKDGQAFAFKGIPFAEPPVGELRWKAPLSPKPFGHEFDATKFGSPCPQMEIEGDSIAGLALKNQSEDCLNLNIWTPTTDAKKHLPVMLWFHGGWSVRGSGSAPAYSGKHFAEDNGVILVTMNYRLGPFGYMAHEKLSSESLKQGNGYTSGNFGFLDQVQALKWLNENIESFGGDPKNISIIGQSAGGASVILHLVSPMSRGLFAKAIVHSGRFSNVNLPLEKKEKQGAQISKNLGCTRRPEYELQCMRNKSVREVFFAVGKAGTYGTGAHFNPILDGVVIPRPIVETFEKGLQAKVPVMMGSTWNDASRYLVSLHIKTPEDFKKFLDKVLKEKFKPSDPAYSKLQKLYLAQTNDEVAVKLDRLTTDSRYTCATRRLMRISAKQQTPAYSFMFGYVPQNRTPGVGAYHGAELTYLFGTLENIKGRAVQQNEYDLSKNIRAYWSQFAKTGNPNTEGLPHWPSSSEDSSSLLWVDTTMQIKKGLQAEVCDLWDQSS